MTSLIQPPETPLRDCTYNGMEDFYVRYGNIKIRYGSATFKRIIHFHESRYFGDL